MRKLHVPLMLAAYAAMMCAAGACHNSNANDELAHHDHNHEHNHEHHHEGHEGHDHGDGQEIILEPEQAKLMGVKVMTAKSGPFNSVIKASGQIVENAQGAAVASAPTPGILTFAPGIVEGRQVSAGTLIATVKSSGMSGGDPNNAAQVAIASAQKEVERLRPLHEAGVVTTAEFNAAVAVLNAARASYSPQASTGRITAPSSGVITSIDVRQGQFVDAGTPVVSITGSGSLSLRADVPQKHFNEIGSITGARIKTPYSSEVIDIADLGGRRVNSVSAPRAMGGYVPVYFSISNTHNMLLPGTAVEVYLQGAPRDNVVTVPVSALSEQQGNFFVYIQLDKEGYLRSPVKLGESNGKDVEILSGVHNGDRVVYEGATAVRLAASSNVIPEGHSHNH